MIESIQNRKAWNELLSEFELFDYYHTFDYHQIAKEENEEAVLLRYSEGDNLVALPIIIRKIPNSGYRDATSVYGYSGPLVRLSGPSLDAARFKNELDGFFLKRGIISVFARLHPFIPHQEECLHNLGEIQVKGNVVNIDLQLPLDEQRQQFRKRYKTYINKSRRLYSVKKAETKKEVETFISLYFKTMERVGAREHYFFEYSYFFNLLKSKEFETDLLLAIDNGNGEVISGAMFIKTNGIVQYHLSGSHDDYSNLHPIKLLIDEMRIQATKEHNKYFNLGGGLGNQEDTLFNFKAGFSQDYRPFKVWKYVVDTKIYRDLVKQKLELENDTFDDDYSAFFPSYRFIK